MEKIQQVQKRNLISLATIGAELNIKEGDYVSLEVKDGGLFLRPVAWHDKSQEYFWTDSFQEKMKEAQKDIENGDFKSFNSLSDVVDYLEKSIDND